MLLRTLGELTGEKTDMFVSSVKRVRTYVECSSALATQKFRHFNQRVHKVVHFSTLNGPQWKINKLFWGMGD
jgi:hypothetical protein